MTAKPGRSGSKEGTGRARAPVSSFAAAAAAKQQEQEALADQYTITVLNKEKRAEFDKKNKWQVEDVRKDFVEKVQEHCRQSMGAELAGMMFSNDFKQHVKCIEVFEGFLVTQSNEFTHIVDLIFKWACVRLQDSSNTKFAVNVFDFLANLLDHFQKTEYVLWDFEAAVLVPLLCEKTGLNNNILKDKVKKLIPMTYPVYDKGKCYHFLVRGLDSKNSRTKAEVLDVIADFITANGIDYCSEKEFKLIAKLADNSDKGIRENAIKVVAEAYKHLDDDIWRILGDITPKVQGLFEQRFKQIKGHSAGLSSS